MQIRTSQIARCLRRVSTSIVVAFLAGMIACGPDLTEPANTDVSGTWFAPGPSAGLTNLTVQLTQTSDGAITGTYAGIGTAGPQFCPPTPPCTVGGTLAGSNTVLQVFFELEDAGQFNGQLIEGTTLKGAMQRLDRLDPIEFTRSQP